MGETPEDQGLRNDVIEALSVAIQKATAGCPVGTIVIKKLVVNVYSARGGGAEVKVNNYALRQDVR